MWGTSLVARCERPELMDDRSIGGVELTEALRQLRVINRLLGAAWPTLEGVVRLWNEAGRPANLSILDVGAGSGDQNRLLLRWAARRGVNLRITLADIHPDTCAEAAAYFRGEPRVQVVQQDLFNLATGSADIVTASLFLHHFRGDELPAVFGAMVRAARLGVVVNDLHRHWLAWGFIKMATHLFSHNRMIRHDAPLSVQRGFQTSDFARLQRIPGLADLRWSWRPLFRYLVMLPAEGKGDA